MQMANAVGLVYTVPNVWDLIPPPPTARPSSQNEKHNRN